MNKKAAIVFAALVSFAAAARAAQGSMESSRAGGLDTFIDVVDVITDLADGRPQPGHPGGHPPPPGHQPPPPPGGHPGGHPVPHPPPPQPHHPPVPPPPPYNPGWDNHNQPTPQYHFGGYRESCRTMEFTAQSPLSQTLEMILEEYGEECLQYNHGFSGPCRPSSKYHSRKVTVNIGPRQLEQWEKERLELCMTAPKQVDVRTGGMLYDYSVQVRNDDGLFRRSTIVTMTPGAKKPSQPSRDEISIGFPTVYPNGEVHISLADSRAEYFRGEKITITADGMRLPEITQNMPVEELLNAFTKFNVTQAFDVAGTYDLKLMDSPKPGKYMVTVKFFRSGPLSSGAEASVIGSFELK